jgi:uncharacterized YkwD family protein
MIKKTASILLTTALTMGLAACANPNKQDIANRTGDRVGMNTNDRGALPLDARYDRNNGIDRDGPLTLNRGRDVDDNLFTGKNRTRRPADLISAAQTSLNSDQYPHTSAVLIQDAKYQYVPLNSNGGNWFQGGSLFQPFQQFFGQQGPAGGMQGQYSAPQQTQPVPGQPQTVPQQTQPVPGRTQTAPQQSQAAPRQIQPAAQPGRTPSNTAVTGTVSQYVQQVIDLTNAQRRQNGLPALKADSQLSSVAQRKAIDMQQNHYFSHTSPTYGSPFDMMRDFGVTYRSAGENIAQGQRTPQEVVTAWMNSPGHRANILNRNYTNIGVGFEATGKHWSQMFIGK